MFQTVRCPDCGGEVVIDLDARSRRVLDYAHVTPACPWFARRGYDDNARRLRPKAAHDGLIGRI